MFCKVPKRGHPFFMRPFGLTNYKDFSDVGVADALMLSTTYSAVANDELLLRLQQCRPGLGRPGKTGHATQSKKRRDSRVDSLSILFNYRSFQAPAVCSGFPEVFWKEGSLERMGEVPLEGFDLARQKKGKPSGFR